MERFEKLKLLLKEQPDDSFLQHALALEYVKRNDDARARALFEQLLARDENYVGSYYHLAKLLERNDEKQAAISWYEKGMRKAKELGNRHAYNELLSAYEELMDG